MALAFFDRIKETTTGTGTGNLVLGGAPGGYLPFSARFANNDPLYYAIYQPSTGDWETGLGAWQTGNVLVRTTILASSNGDLRVNFGAGSKEVWNDLPAGIPGATGLPAFFNTPSAAARAAIPAALLREGHLTRQFDDGSFWHWNGAAWTAFTGFVVGDDSVTLAKLQNIATDRLIGRDTAGTGDPELIALDATLAWSGTGSIGRAAISGDISVPAGSNTAAISAGVVVDADINSAAAIAHSKLATLAARSVLGNPTGAPAALVAITGGGANTVLVDTGAGLVFQALASASLADDSVTFAKLQNIPTDTLIGRDSVGTGDPESISLNATLEFTGTGSIQRAAISGDISVPAGSNTAAISAGVIVNADVNASAAIALTKLQNIATDTLLGRDTAGTGAIESIALDATLVWSGTGSIGRAAISGDVSIPAGSNTAAIAAGAIVDADVNAGAGIALTKLASIATDTLLGRDTAGTGAIESIGLDATLVWSGTGSIGRAAISGDVSIPAGSNTAAIAAGAVTSSKLGDGAVTLSKHADLAGLSVLGRALGTLGPVVAITGAEGQVLRVSGTLGFGSLVTASLSDDAVTFAKLQNINTDRLLGRDTTGVGDPEEIALDATLVWSGTGSIGRAAISGDITIAAGSNTAAIAAGVIVNADVNASAAIALTKLASIATDTLLGRDTAGTGAIESIALNVTLSMTGTGALQRAALSGDVTAPAGSNTTSITAGAVTYAKLQNGGARTVLGNATNAPAVLADIAGIGAGSVLIDSGSGLGFGDPNFGARNITTTGAIILGASPATTGDARLKHGFTFAGRAFGGADIDLIRWGVTANDTLRIGTFTTTVATEIAGGSALRLMSTATFLDYPGSVTPATTGIFRLYHAATAIVGRTTVATDASLFRWGVTANDKLTVGANSVGMTLDLRGDTVFVGGSTSTSFQVSLTGSDSYTLASGVHTWAVGGATAASLSATVFELGPSVVRLRFDATTTTPVILVEASSVAGATGTSIEVAGQDMSGTGATVGGKTYMRAGNSTNGTGGDLELLTGNGATKHGKFTVKVGASNTMFEIEQLGGTREVMGLFGAVTTSNMPANTGDRVVLWSDATAMPTSGFPTGGGILGVDSTLGLEWKGKNGVETTIAPHGDSGNTTKRRMVDWKTQPSKVTGSGTITLASFDVASFNGAGLTNARIGVKARFIAADNTGGYHSYEEFTCFVEVVAGVPTIGLTTDRLVSSSGSGGSPFSTLSFNVTATTTVRLQGTLWGGASSVESWCLFEVTGYEV